MARVKGDHSAHVASLAERMERDLSAIRHAMRRALNTEVDKGALTGPQTALMKIVLRKPGLSVRDLSRDVSLAQSTVSGIVDRLEKRGLVQRTPDEMDKRMMRVSPSMQVRKWVDEDLPQLKVGPLQAALQRADPEERETLANALARLRKLLTPETASL